MNAIVSESALRILDDHRGDGDRYLQASTARLIARDEQALTPEQRRAREMQNTLIRAAFVARERRFDSQFGVLA